MIQRFIFTLAFALASLVAVSVVLPGTAMAQVEDFPDNNSGMQTGSRFSRAPETADQAEARWMQKRVANCVWNRNEDEVRRLLANSDFYQIDYAEAGVNSDTLFDDLEVGYCMGRLMQGVANRTLQMYMQIQYSTLRNLLAEEAYLNDFDGPPVIAPDHVVDIAARFDGQRPHPQVRTMAAMADCVTFNRPQAAHDMLRARPGSGREQEIVDQLGPVIAACANSREDELTIASSLVRQLVADGMWSRMHYGSSTAAEVEPVASEQSVPAGDSGLEERFARCVVANDPDAARAILAASSQQEFSDAIVAIMPTCPINGSIDSRGLNRALEAALGEATT